MKQIRNIGIFAHVDAGKTTLSEQLLAHAGAIRATGSVDTGTAHTDRLPVERRRGISVKATCVSFAHRDVVVNLIDTPGHADFSGEVERSLWALDAAVLVVCAVEGVQPQTQVLFEAMQEQGLPVLIFINKTDRAGADPKGVLAQIRQYLSDRAVAISDTDGIVERICDTDEQFLARYLEGECFPESVIREKLATLCRCCEAYPVFFGSALRDQGIGALLDGIVELLPSPVPEEMLCGVVFAAEQDRALGRGVWVRLFGGSLENREAVTLPGGLDPATGEEKQAQLKVSQIHGPDGKPVGRLEAGSIGVVYGLGNVAIGHVLGDRQALPRPVTAGRLRTPLITVQAIPEKSEQMTALRQACQILAGEDPLLQVRFIRGLNELQLQVMGTIQLEVLAEILRSRFDLGVSFSAPAVIYRETITAPARGFVAYTMPKPCWAILEFDIEPLPRGSGVVFESRVAPRDILLRYQHQVAQAVPLALAQGRLGWEVTDVKITLTGGNHHMVHTHPLDFIVATPMGIQNGLCNGGSTLLEPILQIRFLLPQDCVGRVISDVALMRGQVEASVSMGDRVELTALVPVSTSLEYAVTLASFSGGRGGMSARLHSYRECPLELGATAQRRNVDPLDTAKYILAARSALEGGIFDL